MKTSAWIITAFAIAALAAPLQAQGPQRQKQKDGQRQGRPDRGQNQAHKGPQGMIKWVTSHQEKAKELGITDEQISQLDAVLKQSEKESIELEANAKQAQLELRNLMQEDQPDEAAVMGAIDKTSAARASQQKAKTKVILSSKSILGKELIDAVRQEMKASMKAKGDKMREKRQQQHKKMNKKKDRGSEKKAE